MPFLVDYIVKQETLPENINIVLATSRIREGINIKDDNITAMFCEAHDIIDIAQFSGRYRGNVETLYIIHDTKAHYRKEDIESLELEYNFLSSFELVNINIYSSILLYKATGIKTPYLNDKNYNYYKASITSLPTEKSQMWTISGLSPGLPFALKIFFTASGLSASAASP